MDASDVDGINASLIGASFLPYWPSLCSFQSLKWFELVGKAKCGFKSTVKRCKIYCEIYKVVFLTGSPDFQYQNEKTCSANEELFTLKIS